MTTENQLDKANLDKPELDQDDLEKPEDDKGFNIQIDRVQYRVLDEKLTGAMLRSVPPTPIPSERDIFEVIPGHPDKKIKDDDTIEIRDGLRFFTAPNTINPGINLAGHKMTDHSP